MPEGLLPLGSTVKWQCLYVGTTGLSNGTVNADADKPVPLMRTIAERLQFALKKEGRSQNSLEAAVGFAVNRYATGKRGGTTVDVDKMKAIARELHVEFDWLVSGDGAMRRDGRDTTPAEEAMALARRSGIREDVWQRTLERYQDRADTMTALDWALAIHTENELWGRGKTHPVEGIESTPPRPRVDKPVVTRPRRPSGST